MLKVSAVRAFADNYIWLIHSPRDATRVVAVDPGDAQPVEQALTRGFQLAGILITHRHADHVGGVDRLLRGHRVPIFGPAGEKVPGEPRPLREGDTADFPELDLHFEVLDVPGHTAGHIAYVGHGALFCGDTLFSAGCGRLFEGTPEQMSRSLAKLSSLPDDTQVYCAHEYTVSNLKFARTVEPENGASVEYLEECRSRRTRGEATVPSTIRRERNVNPFLRCDRQSVKQAAEAKAGRRLQNDIEIFAVIREWKDGFTS
jgi:hydroxyacylglutathione hydrolase